MGEATLQRSALVGFAKLAASQVATRLVGFSLNLLTARSLSPEAYGVVAVQLHLLNSSLLFLAREGLRRACLRLDGRSALSAGRVLGCAGLSVPVGVALSTPVLCALGWARAEAAWRRALAVQGASIALELCAEPLYQLASAWESYGTRAALETLAVLCKSALALLLVRRADAVERRMARMAESQGLLRALLPTDLLLADPAVAFSVAQLFYALCLVLGFGAWGCYQLLVARPFAQGGEEVTQAREEATQGREEATQGRGDGEEAGSRAGSLPPLALPAPPPLVLPTLSLHAPTLRLAGVFSLQAAQKLVLAEGSRAALAWSAPAGEQGVYGLVGNLGSLAVRAVFQPAEEAAFAAFSRAAARREPDVLGEARLLRLLVRSMLLLAGVAAALAPACSHLAVWALYGPTWAASQAPNALALYAFYLALLASNGTLEAYVHAVAEPGALAKANAFLGAVAVAQTLAGVAGARWLGASGLLAGDAGGAAFRLLYNVAFARKRLLGKELPDGKRTENRGLGAPASLGLGLARSTLGALFVAGSCCLLSRLAFLPEAGGVGLARLGIVTAWIQAGRSSSPIWLVPALSFLRRVRELALACRAVAHVGVVCLSLAFLFWRCEEEPGIEMLKEQWGRVRKAKTA